MGFDSERGNKLGVILPVGDWLYVAEKKLRIHVFSLPTLGMPPASATETNAGKFSRPR